MAVRETFPRATRRVCCQHLYMNCKNNGFSGSAFHKLFWIAANAYNEYVFGKAMEKISEYNANATAYLNSCIEQWSRHKFDSTVCCDHNTTNFVESFNACTKPFRDMPVFSLLEGITLLIIFMHNITPELVVCCLIIFMHNIPLNLLFVG